MFVGVAFVSRDMPELRRYALQCVLRVLHDVEDAEVGATCSSISFQGSRGLPTAVPFVQLVGLK